MKRFIAYLACRPGITLVACGSLALLFGLFAIPALQMTYTALLVTFLLAMFVAVWSRVATLSTHSELLTVPLALAQDQQILDIYRSLSESLRSISANLDPVFRDLTIERLRQLDKEFSQIARGQIVFVGTETWRMAYERLLRSRGLYLYRSVAFAKTANYWQDEPGRRSMQVNFEMQAQGLNIERIAIIPDHLWPAAERFPIEPIGTWLDEQHQHGVSTKLVRLSELENEPDLLADVGIYGNRAVGVQQLDEQGRTIRFTLSFDFSEVLAAEQRWERLSLYATSYRDLVAQAGPHL